MPVRYYEKGLSLQPLFSHYPANIPPNILSQSYLRQNLSKAMLPCGIIALL